MKNAKYFPFERNKYFYGKLLSVDDFELEQRYINNKRRMTNRYLFGMGVAAGMDVVRIDEHTLSVESGFALDDSGREIIIDNPVIKKMALLEGYQSAVEEGDKDYVYLCVDYDEKEAGAVHNIAGSVNAQADSNEYNRIKETYRLYLTEAEPETELLDKTALYQQVQVLYNQDGIKIKQIVPKYALSESTFEIRYEIENLTRKYVSFSYDVSLECLSYNGQGILPVNFNEMQVEKTGHYTISYMVNTIGNPDADGEIVIKKSNMNIYIDKEKVIPDEGVVKAVVNFTTDDIRNHMVEDYYQMPMDSIVPKNHMTHIYLAKIHLIRVGESPMVERVERLPFHQYILNQNLVSAIQQMTIDGGNYQEKRKRDSITGLLGKNTGDSEYNVRMVHGSYELELDGGGYKGTRYVGEEIVHGLGLGKFHVELGVEDENQVITYGSSEVFEDTKPMIELAVKAYPDRGTFQIGGRLLEQVIANSITVHWTVWMNEQEYVQEKITRKIFIKPSVLELSTRETHYLEAICTNMDDKDIEWKVKDEVSGGTISENGMYTAPNEPGVYEVVARSVAYPDIKASIFVVVRKA